MLHHHEGPIAHAPHFVHAADRRVIERCGDACFLQQRSRGGGVRVVDDLDRHRAPQLAIARAVDNAHAARAEDAVDAVRPETLSDTKRLHNGGGHG